VIPVIIVAIVSVGFVVFCLWQFLRFSPEHPGVSGESVAKWLMTAVVLALLGAIIALAKDPVRLLLTGQRAGSGVAAQSLAWHDIAGVAILAGFLAFVLLLWLSVILVSGDSRFDDPFHVLPKVASRLRLNPVRFPLFFLLSLAIPGCGLSAYVLTREAIALRSSGVTAVGRVIGSARGGTRLNSGGPANGYFPTIQYRDASGAQHTIQRALTWPLSRLATGDLVEVIYPARRPDHGIVNTWDELYLVPVFFGVMTVAFLVVLRGVQKETIGWHALII
jgi:hypothetical protein